MTPADTLTAVVFLGAATCFTAVAAIVTGIGADERLAFRRRLRKLRGAGANDPAVAHGRSRRARRKSTTLSRGLFGDIQRRLIRAGLAGTSPLLYLLLALLLGAFSGMVLYSLLLMPLVALSTGLATAVFLPNMVLGILTTRRETRFLRQFPDAIDLIIRGVKSGYPVAEAIGLIADELPDPIGGEFRVIVERLRLGQSLEAALAEAAERIGLPDMRFFAVSLSVQHETGGNIGETLQNLSDLLRRRQQMKLKVRALSSQARASAWIVGSLPFIVILLMAFMNPEYLSGLIHDPTGRMLLAAGIGSQLLGVLVMAKMTRFKI